MKQDESRWQDAADILWSAWQTGDVIDALGQNCRPQTRADGYAIQSLVAGHSTRPAFGWKIAATSAAGQQHIGVDGPLAGRLLHERVFADGARLTFGANRMAVAEPEFAFRLGRALGPRDKTYSVAEVLAAVEALHIAIEFPDSRFADFASAGAANLIADNACAHEFVLGPAVTGDWRAVDLAAFRMDAEVVCKVRHEGIGANVLGDPREALTWLVNEVTGLGITLGAGEVITTGTCAVPLPIASGDKVRMDFGAFGVVTAQLAD